MLRNKFILSVAAVGILISCAVVWVPAQKTTAGKDVLARYEKSIAQGDFAAIERELLDYAIANPKDAKAFELLGRLRFEQNRLGEAKSLYQKALSLDATSAAVKINLAVINFQTGDVEQARANLNGIAEQNIADDALRLKLAEAFALVGNCQKALGGVEKVAAKIKNSDALPMRAECYWQSGETPKIIELIPAAKILAKKNPAAAIRFAEVLSRAALHKQSAGVARSIVAVAPQNAAAHVMLAKSEIYLKDFVNAKIHLERAAKINQNAPDLLFVKALFESEQGNQMESLDLLEKSLAANPNSETVLSQFVVTAMRVNQAGRALRAAEKLLALKPNEPEFIYLHGAAALQNNSLRAAENSLNRFAELRPQDARGCLALGLTFAAQTGRTEAARTQLKKCVETNPNDFEANYQLGLSYKTQGEIEKAIEHLEATVKSSPNYALALRDLGAVYLQSGAEMKARVALEKSAAINPKDGDTHFQLSRLYNLIGEKDLAKKHLEIFQKLRNPNQNGM